MGIGIGIGIIFSVAYPDLAESINDSIKPTIESIGIEGMEILKNLVIKVIYSHMGILK